MYPPLLSHLDALPIARGCRSTVNCPVIDLNGSAPGGQIYPSQSGDAPTDNFALLNNYLATFLGGQPCLSPPNGSAPYNPSGDTANRACYNNQYVTRTNQGTGADFSNIDIRSEEHTSELQSLMRISYAVFCLKKKKTTVTTTIYNKPT